MTPFALQPVTLPLVLMVVIAPLASFDILYFHLWKLRLYRVPSARAESVTHVLRGALFSIGAYLLASYRFNGRWFWVVGTLFLLDFVNNVADVALEPRSRAPLGGLPGGEYVIHIIGSTFAGAITLSYFVVGWANRLEASALVSAHDSLPTWLAWQGKLLAGGGAALTLFELGLLLHSVKSLRTGSAT